MENSTYFFKTTKMSIKYLLFLMTQGVSFKIEDSHSVISVDRSQENGYNAEDTH